MAALPDPVFNPQQSFLRRGEPDIVEDDIIPLPAGLLEILFNPMTGQGCLLRERRIAPEAAVDFREGLSAGFDCVHLVLFCDLVGVDDMPEVDALAFQDAAEAGFTGAVYTGDDGVLVHEDHLPLEVFALGVKCRGRFFLCVEKRAAFSCSLSIARIKRIFYNMFISTK